MVKQIAPVEIDRDIVSVRRVGRRALLIRNAMSRRGSDDLAPVLDFLRAHGLTLVELDASEATNLDSAAQDADLIIVAGGDGTIHHAAPTLLAAGKPFGILPLGTANDLARSLDVPADPLQAAQVIIDGAVRSIDLGEVNGEPFFNVASLGVSVALAREMTRETKRRFGAFSYVLAGARALMRARRFRAIIEGNGRAVRVRTFQIAVGNGRYYGGGMSVNENCRIGDGKLYLYSLEMRNLWTLALMALDFRAGAHGAWEEVRSDTGDRFVIRTRRPRQINADGEIITQTPATFSIRRNALQVFAPPDQEDA
ncbi:MAG: lipid kinase [Beijerinckiaceae bacterium]|nr:lipid kinase [Beijerinckiaceae bacterium]